MRMSRRPVKQITLSMTGYFDKGKKTRREQFLAEMDRVVPWGRLCALIEPHYPKASHAGRRQPIPLERMLRIYCLQQWYNLSDPATEEALYDSIVMRKFVGITTDADIIPDETTILRFRRLLEIHQLTEALFAEVNGLLSERGLFVGKGTIVDATLIHAPSSTKNAQKKRDPEMHQTRKGKQWYFGMKMHTGVDAGSGLVHTIRRRRQRARCDGIAGTAARQRGRALRRLGYHSKALEALALLVGLSFYVCKRGSRGHPLTERERMRNRRYSECAQSSSIYLVVKRLWGHARHATAGSRRIWRKCIRCLLG